MGRGPAGRRREESIASVHTSFPAATDPREYKRVEIETASPGKLLLMLYDAAIQRCESAAERMRAGEIGPAHFDLLRVQDILTELMVALDPEASAAPVRELFALYDYMHRTLVRANVQKQPEPIHEVLGLLNELRRAWVAAVSAGCGTVTEPDTPPAEHRRIDVQT